MTTALVVITDGRRHCIDKTIPSLLDAVHGDITSRLIYDDSGDPENADWLQDRFGRDGFFVFSHPEGRQGFGGAIRYVWRFLASACNEPYVLWSEDDFLYNRPVDLPTMIALLDAFPHLAQLVLKRQPWNDEEKAAGGIVESHPADYEEHTAITTTGTLIRRLEHRRFWSTNPHLFRRGLCDRGWPNVEHSEGVFTHQLLADPDLRFAFMGARADEPWVTHIGHQRVGVGY